MPAWTSPEVWETNDLITAQMMQEQVLDNLRHLYDRLKPKVWSTQQSTQRDAYGGTWQDIQSVVLTVDKAFSTSYLRVYLQLEARSQSGFEPRFRIYNATQSTTLGYEAIAHRVQDDASWATNSVAFTVSGLAAGTYTIKGQFKGDTSKYMRVKNVYLEAIELPYTS